ncbi:FliM/FliN family flagellar motor C-terminal domain-containing protein [Metallumcola ferriviriculae]|uniref:FliM/FliN family flagellar motor C-terminal domain-containing protein n=1 Tax=Metallumcola ferriviriculae TaxID=3039180 RepID=A0AAU0UR73_9FIRM|nr:FliM/FliN family flagellar motor C-terminal domain-containing protein [Desulfitibacteraceae bacterium MK1]
MSRNITEDDIRVILEDSGGGGLAVKKAKFLPLKETPPRQRPLDIGFLWDINMEMSVELGEVTKTVRDILNMQSGSILSLNRLAGEHVEISLGGISFARGEVVVINDVLAVRINSLKNSEPDHD